MTTPTPTYDFAEETQREIVACMMLDRDFMRRSDGLIEAAYVEADLPRAFAQLALDHWKTYHSTPTIPTWVSIARKEMEKGLLSSFPKEEITAFLKEAAGLEIRDRGWLLDNIAAFAKERAIYNAFLENVSRLAKKDDPDRYRKIEGSLKKAFEVALKDDQGEYDFFERIAERTAERLEIAAGRGTGRGITTGVEELDGLLLHRGWGRKELSLLMGGAKASKSMTLYGFAANAVRANHNVLVITCENSREIVASRLDANFARIGTSEHVDHPHAVEREIKAVAARPMGRLMIEEFPTGSLKPSGVRRVLDKFRTKGIEFDLVVIDYLDIMAPEHRYDNPIENSKSVYVDVRGIAGEYDIAVLSATQTNREGVKAATVRMEHVAEDFNRIRIADIVISINRTEDERAAGKARFYFAACRNQRDGMTLFVKQDLDKCLGIAEVEMVE